MSHNNHGGSAAAAAAAATVSAQQEVQNEVTPLNESTGVVCVSSEPEL